MRVIYVLIYMRMGGIEYEFIIRVCTCYVRVMCVCIRYLLCAGIICGVMVIVVIVVIIDAIW